MLFFKKKTRKENPVTEKAAGHFAAAILKVQVKWAAYMGKLTASWSPGQKKLALILFCAVMGANSGIALYKAVNTGSKPSLAIFKPDRIKALPLPEDTLSNAHLNRDRQALAAAIDSLERTDSGRLWLRELQYSRPGLWDSLQIVIANDNTKQ